MLIYFFSITYGIYLASTLEFIIFTGEFFEYLVKADFYQFFRGRPLFDIFDYHIEWERNYAILYGTPIKV